ncbi:MAG: hypothetical protein LC798_13050 [Chloroflexi bacterium]|nr:hypothetical protein [Chloroflexota bacterium]
MPDSQGSPQDKGRRRIELMPVPDHERAVAELEGEIERLGERAIYWGLTADVGVDPETRIKNCADAITAALALPGEGGDEC